MGIVVVNGPAGIGKSTVARELAAAVGNGVCIHADALKDFVVTRDDDRPRGLAYVGAARLAELHLQAGYERVVVEFVFPDAAAVTRFTDALPAATDVAVFTLWAPLPVVVAREAGRTGRERIPQMVVESWTRIRENLPRLGTVIDADRPVEAVVGDLERLTPRG